MYNDFGELEKETDARDSVIRYENGSTKGYDSYGNLTYQTNVFSGASESYTYDNLHRLTQSVVNYTGGNATIDYAYDAVGNFKKKTDYSANSDNAYQYATGSNKISSVALKDNGGTVTFGYDASGNQTHRNGSQEISYNAFNKPTAITKNGQNITLSYGPDIMRYQQVRVVEGGTIITWYIGKHFELEHSPTTGTVNARHFISDVAIVDTYNNQPAKIAFTHRDRLGSTVTMTDHNNTLQSMRHFDPFGKPRGGDWALLDPPQFPFNIADNRTDIRRGFTDHEHLDEAELIHMNGRVYDYNVGRFMSVDPVIQSPTNSQSINPYSYIMNNPLAGTDPTGYVSRTEIEDHRPAFDCLGVYCLGALNSTDENNGTQGQTSSNNVNNSTNITGGLQATEINSQQSIASQNNSGVGSGDNQNSITYGGTRFEIVENFNTTETGSRNVTDNTGNTFKAYEFTKQHDSLTAIENSNFSGTLGASVSDYIGNTSSILGTAADLIPHGVGSSPVWIGMTKTKGMQIYKTNHWKGNGAVNFKSFAEGVTKSANVAGSTLLGIGIVNRGFQYTNNFENIRNSSNFDIETIDLSVDIGVAVAAAIVGSPVAILAGLTYFAADTFLYDGNLSKAISDGTYQRDIRSGFKAIRELF